jgi:hypothetical protein
MPARKSKTASKKKTAKKKAAAKKTSTSTRYSETVELTAPQAKSLGIPADSYRISTMVFAMCNAGKTNDELFEAVQKHFPESECAKKKALTTWYRWKGESTGKITTKSPESKPKARKTATKKASGRKRKATARKA